MGDPVLVFVAGRIRSAQIDIQSQYHVVKMMDSRTGMLWRNGRQTRFVIVTLGYHATGLKVSECVWLPCSRDLKAAVRDEIKRAVAGCMAMVPVADRRPD